jgi:hypothetical protein
MISIELQILKIEGLDPGTICKVFIDNEEVQVKNYQFSISKHGIVHLEFFKGRTDLGGVFFSSELLAQVAYSYVPIYTPAVFIDHIPSDIDPPRVLLIQTASSLETSMLSSKCETICFEESLESFKLKDDSLDKSFYANRPELEYTRKAESKIDPFGENKEFLGKEIKDFRELNQKSTKKERENFEGSEGKLRSEKRMENESWNFSENGGRTGKSEVNTSDVKIIENWNETQNECIQALFSVIKDLEKQRDSLLNCKKPLQNDSFVTLTNKIMQDSLHISKLVKEKNSLTLRVKELEKENRQLKNKNIVNELTIKEVLSRENLLRKEFESKKMIESLTNAKF